MQAWTRNYSVSSQALYHRATAPPPPFDVERKCNVVLLTQLCHTGSLVISFAACFFFLFCFFTANNVDPASSGSSFEPCHKIVA